MKDKLIDALLVLACAVIALLAFWTLQAAKPQAAQEPNPAASEPAPSLCIDAVALALGVIEVESSFKLDADNGLCYGLMQLNRRYFPDGLTPGENIRVGVEYLGQLLDRYDTVEAALTSYNAGHDTGKRGYANAVLAAAEKWVENV